MNTITEPAIRGWMVEHGPRLIGVARAFAGGDTTPEDIVQEVWIIAHRKAHSLESGAHIGAWLHRVTLNVGRDKRRRRLNREKALEEAGGPPMPQLRRPRTIDQEMERRHLWRTVAALPSLQQRVLLLRIVAGASTKEAAESLNRAESTVKNSLAQALASLRKRVDAEANEGPAFFKPRDPEWT